MTSYYICIYRRQFETAKVQFIWFEPESTYNNKLTPYNIIQRDNCNKLETQELDPPEWSTGVQNQLTKQDKRYSNLWSSTKHQTQGDQTIWFSNLQRLEIAERSKWLPQRIHWKIFDRLAWGRRRLRISRFCCGGDFWGQATEKDECN